MGILRFFKNWTLPVAMTSGVILYFVYVNIPFLAPTKPFVTKAVGVIQPLLIFLMLFFTFCKVDLRELRPCRWQVWLLLIQGVVFLLLGALLIVFPYFPGRVLVEGAMLCVICPTATAAAVVTRKLGGNAGHITSYIILINILAALLIPLVLPFVHPQPGVGFALSFALILGKVFPLLLLPFVAALVVRLFPRVHSWLTQFHELPFYLWAVALTLAIALTTRSIVHSDVSFGYQAGLAVVSLVCCVLQFWAGKKIGKHYGDSMTAGQSLGQKNTVFAIWLGYTFFTPVTAVASGFYSVWHNIFNSRQLYLQRKREAEKL